MWIMVGIIIAGVLGLVYLIMTLVMMLLKEIVSGIFNIGNQLVTKHSKQ